jgi:hypothetical protein
MKTNYQDPQTSEIRSTQISGIQESLGKIEDILDMQLQAETGVPLTEVYISVEDRYRIYQAPAGKQNWAASPAPIIKKNGVAISEGFTIDYTGGAIIVSPSAISTDVFTADVSYTKTAGNKLEAHLEDYALFKGGTEQELGEIEQQLIENNTDIGKIKNGAFQTSGLKRSPIRYRNSNSVFVYKRNVVMGGFRFMGEYLKPLAPLFTFPTIPQVVDFSPANLVNSGYETAMSVNNWYAVFAVANDGESPNYKVMPFLRAYDVVGKVITLGVGGEFSNDLANNAYPKSTKTYTFANDVFVGAEILQINGSDGTRSGQFVGKIAHVVANTGATVTMDSTIMQKGGYFLIAPPDYQHYCYLGSFYFDGAELRNRSDSGEIVRAVTVYLDNTGSQYPLDGDISAGVTIDFRGFISPLATGIILGINSSYSTASTGFFGYSIGSDSAHFIHVYTGNKVTAGSESYMYDTGVLPFTFGQTLYIQQTGISSGATRKVNIKGYVES